MKEIYTDLENKKEEFYYRVSVVLKKEQETEDFHYWMTYKNNKIIISTRTIEFISKDIESIWSTINQSQIENISINSKR